MFYNDERIRISKVICRETNITLGFSSTVLTAKMLAARNKMGAYYGRVAFCILILQDLVAIGIIAYEGGGKPSPFERAGE